MDFRTGKIINDLPLVTIGVLSYNYSKYLLAALNSLLVQTYNNIELIIIDDCSTENSVEIINQWISTNNLHCTFIINEKNEGITKVSNKLVALSKGKYINLFATDDIMLPEKIEQQVNLLEQAGEEYGMCYANVETMDEENNTTGLYCDPAIESLPQGDVLEAFAFNQMKFATPSALIRIAAYKKCGMYDERVLIEDYNFWLRFFACWKACICNYPSLIYRVKKESGVFNKWYENKNERYFHDRILSNFGALPFIKNATVKIHLQNKIGQYINSLSINQSGYTKKLIWHLISKGYYQIPKKVFIREGLKLIQISKKQFAEG